MVTNKIGTSSSTARLNIQSNSNSLSNLLEEQSTNQIDYKEISEIARGRFSIIKRAKYIKNEYCLKLISKKFINKDKAYNEYIIASSLNHNNFLKTYQFVDTDDYYYIIIMEL